ncbi:alpha/beta fold hydrolase [Curtobacterium sp. B18]|uniref:alpha/beta fold hydrolase n=1 Tax=Curtobacterium sp. B18 TaxID=95614 RepID=UPI0003456905|nr:alpha/beta hydrolase [Curtobacterium sp. B18]
MTGGRIAALGTAAGAVGTLGLGAFVARRLLFPTPYTATATVRHATETETEFVATRDTRLPGTYRLTRDGVGLGVHEVTGTRDGTLRRRTDSAPAAGEWGWDALLYDDLADVPGDEPADAPGHEPADVAGGDPTDAPGHEPATAGTHVVHVHGQSLGPRQVLRGIPVWRALGATSEVVDTTDLPLRSLDPGAVDRIVAAVRAARRHGATRVVLQGWSAGALACSVAASRVEVDGLVGIAPLLSVSSALRGAVSGAHLPAFVGTVAARIATTGVLSRLAGAAAPVQTTAWQASATPTLLVHSAADALVAEADVAAQTARPGTRAVAFRTAPHTLEWNEDPERWEGAVRDFAATL